MPFELFLALRYLVARRKQAFLSLISVISTIGVAVGVMALIIALALMTGLQGELRDRIVGASPHIYVWKVGEGLSDVPGDMQRIKQVARVTGASPIVLGKALITAGEQQAFITVKGSYHWYFFAQDKDVCTEEIVNPEGQIPVGFDL